MGLFSKKQKLLLEKYNGIALARGRTLDGDIFYAYIMADANSLEKLHIDLSAGKAVNFASYGRILAFGPGENPPEDIHNFVKNKYGFNEASNVN